MEIPIDTNAGLGLRVARERLRARYGDEASLETIARPGNGFLARVILPVTFARVEVHA
jgi:hypothetical protein